MLEDTTGAAKTAKPIGRFSEYLSDYGNSLGDLTNLTDRLEHAVYMLTGTKANDVPVNAEKEVEPDDIASRLQFRLHELNSLIGQLNQITQVVENQV